MHFELSPILELMIDLYQKPASLDRFHEYLHLLQGDSKGDMTLPLSGFNPMAKGHVLEILLNFRKLELEQIIEEVIREINQKEGINEPNHAIKVIFNLADDLKGGWTNQFTSDFDSKFRINAYIQRQFCVPFFWTSEAINKESITKRAREYIYRSIYWLRSPKPQSLEEHVAQEIFVSRNAGNQQKGEKPVLYSATDAFFQEHKSSKDYGLIFNFFYSDKASESLGMPCYGIKEEFRGFEYVAYL